MWVIKLSLHSVGESRHIQAMYNILKERFWLKLSVATSLSTQIVFFPVLTVIAAQPITETSTQSIQNYLF